MSNARPFDPTLIIPPPPARFGRRASWRLSTPSSQRVLDALREASLVGMAALAVCWGLAELAVVLLAG